MTYVDYIIIGVSCAFIVGLCVAIIILHKKKAKSVHPKQKERLVIDSDVNVETGYLSQKEFTFYKALCSASADIGYVAFPHVNLCDIISSRDENVKKNPVFHSDVDFCLFSPTDFKPICIVDLYDGTISNQSVFEIDGFAEKALKNAGIPVVKMATEISYDIEHLKKRILEAISASTRRVR